MDTPRVIGHKGSARWGHYIKSEDLHKAGSLELQGSATPGSFLTRWDRYEAEQGLQTSTFNR